MERGMSEKRPRPASGIVEGATSKPSSERRWKRQNGAWIKDPRGQRRPLEEEAGQEKNLRGPWKDLEEKKGATRLGSAAAKVMQESEAKEGTAGVMQESVKMGEDLK